MTQHGLLPTQITPHEDETAESFMARLVRANSFYSLAEFCDFTGTRRYGIAAMEDAELSEAARWSGLPETRLRRFAISSGNIIEFGCAEVKRVQLRGTQNRYCPHCFEDDLQNGTGRAATRISMRATWRWNMISTCPDHGVQLLDLPEDFDALNLRDFAKPQSPDVDTHVSLDHDRYFGSRLLERPGDAYLDVLPLYVAAELCAVLGALQEMAATGKIAKRVPAGMTNPDCLAAGYRIAIGGKQEIWDFLTAYVVKMVGKAPTYPMVYSPVLMWLRDTESNDSYSSVRDLFQAHAEDHLPLEPGDLFLEPVQSRRVHTIYSAAKEYGLPEARIRSVLLEQDQGRNVIAEYGTRSLIFRKDATHALLSDAASLLTTAQAAEKLGCAMTQIDALLKEGCLPFSSNRAASGRVFRWVAAQQVQALLDDLENRVSSAAEHHQLTPILEATKRAKRSFPEIISLVKAGRLSKLGKLNPVLQLEQILVDPAEVIAAFRSREDDGLVDRGGAAKALGTRRETINDLLASGLITGFNVPNSKMRTAQLLMKTSDLEEFSEKFVLLDRLAKDRGEAAIPLRRRIEGAGVQEVYEANRKASRVYQREDIERAGF